MEPSLDRIDFEILAALQKDARLSNKELAAHVGLAPSTCLVRVRRLVEAKVLRGFHADIDPAALGVGLMAIISVRLTRHSHDAFDAFREHVLSLPEVVSVYHLAGAVDFLIHVALRDVDHLRALVVEGFTRRAEVAHLETQVLFEYVRAAATPNYREGESGEAGAGRAKRGALSGTPRSGT
jgi:DNA-binding Lrp family transcriptional regulator